MPTKKKTKKTAKKTRSSTKTSAKKSTEKSTKKKTSTDNEGKKKTASKRSATTKRSDSSQKRVLVCAGDEHCFWTSDGQILANLEDLRDALAGMADQVFKYHVTREKNDFADWVEQVLDDKTLAESLRRSRKPATARTVVVRRLKVYHR